MERSRIGILGGTLDPVHEGHLQLLRMARAQMSLDEAVLLPAGDPPHKRCRVRAADRLEMARLAAGDEFSVSDREVARAGRTYTVDTLRALRDERPGCEIVYIIGADTLPKLTTWREYGDVFALCTFAAARRAGQGGEIPAGARVFWLEGEPPAISSTEIRALAAMRAPLTNLVPPAVERYIRARGLYLTVMPEGEAEDMLRGMLTPRRFRHTLGVRDTAERLARLHGLDAAAARVAGLLHDAAKCLPREEQLRLAESLADAEELSDAELAHAPAGVAVARQTFGVEDAEILSAIRCHTLGRADMTGVELAVYVADFIEPGRAEFPGLSRARALAETDLVSAARLCAELTERYLARLGRQPHPRTLEVLKQNGRVSG